MLRWLTDASLADSIAGDLVEQRRIRGRLWFWRSSVAVVIYFLSQRARSAMSDLARTFRLGSGNEWRQSLRSLRRTPWYSLTIIGVIALTMTFATTVFAIVDGVLFKPLSYPRAEQLYIVSAPYNLVASSREMAGWAAAVPDVQMAMRGQIFTAGSTNEDQPAAVMGTVVGPGFFEVLGVRAFIGGFRPEHFQPSGGRVPVLVSYRLWRRVLGGDTAIVGKPLDLVGAVNQMMRPLPGFEVAGVLPRDFALPFNVETPDVVLPLALSPEQSSSRNESSAIALVRIPDGVSVDSVRTRINAVAQTQGFRDANSDGVRMSPDVSVYQVLPMLTLYTKSSFATAFIAAAVLVLIAIVNVSSLALARSRQRRAELALRQALGASRWQLAGLALRETGPLIAIGAGLGLLGAPPLIDAVTSVIGRIALLKTPAIDARVVAFSAVTCLVQVLVVVTTMTRAVPAGGVAEAVGRGAAVTTRRRWFSFSLVSLQVALTMVLAVGGALVMGSLWWAWQQDPGIDPDRVIAMDVAMGRETPNDQKARMNAILDRVRAMPDVENIATVGLGFLSRFHAYYTFTWPDGAPTGREEPFSVSGDFFGMLGMHALEGQLPTPADLERDPDLAVLSARIARKHWPGQSAVGQTFRVRTQTYHVVAVVPDARLSSLDDTSYGQVYLALRGVPGVLLIKARSNPERLLRSLVADLRSPGSPVGITRAVTLREAYGRALQSRTFYAWFFGGFAACALVIVAVGILGLLAMTSAMRTREMGIRLALGATRDGLVGLLVREQMRSVLTGLLAGGLVASWAVKYVRQYLYQFTMYDTRLWGIAILTILVTAALGAFVPAWRTSRVDPVQALRVD
jgi:putative ABC transport system permease protein